MAKAKRRREIGRNWEVAQTEKYVYLRTVNRFCKGYKNYREDKVIPLEVQDQTRLDSFYSSDIAKGLCVLNNHLVDHMSYVFLMYIPHF